MKASHPLHILSSCITKFTICTYENHVHENGSKWVITSFLGHNNFHFQQPEALTMCILLHSPFLVISSLYLASSYLSPSFFTPYISLNLLILLGISLPISPYAYLSASLFLLTSFLLFFSFSFLISLSFCFSVLFHYFISSLFLSILSTLFTFLGPSLYLKSCKNDKYSLKVFIL